MIASNVMTVINGKNVIIDHDENPKTFNKHHNNIVGNSGGYKPNKIGTTLRSLNDIDIFDRINESNQNHPSVLKIKNNFGSVSNSFDFQQSLSKFFRS